MVLRREVLRVYRQILQVARSWQAAVEMDTPTERAYIKEETRRLFRKNRDVSVFILLHFQLPTCDVCVEVAYWNYIVPN